jgi:23S rRNA pseudouridine1911/1915/1917 synthase
LCKKAIFVTSENKVFHLIPHGSPPERLDIALARISDVSRTRIQKWIEQGCIIINDHPPSSPHTIVRSGDKLVITPPKAQPSHMVAENIPLDIIFEDQHILVINKQAGLTVHPGAGHKEHTLIHALPLWAWLVLSW